jgi:integrase
VPGRGASWEQEYRDLEAAILGELQAIQKLLGHSDIKTTMIYLQTVLRGTGHRRRTSNIQHPTSRAEYGDKAETPEETALDKCA